MSRTDIGPSLALAGLNHHGIAQPPEHLKKPGAPGGGIGILMCSREQMHKHMTRQELVRIL